MVAKSNLKFTSSEDNILRKKGYEIQKKIGQGGYAKVYRGVFNQADGKQIEFACKIIDTAKSSKKFLTKFLPRELKILTKLNHPHIIEIHSIFYRKGRCYMFMRVAEKGDLLNFIVKHGVVEEKWARIWTRQLSLAIQYLHTMFIAHRDIKCENCLITVHNNIKLSDFGFSRYVVGVNNAPVLSETFCGSLSYAPPEILKGEPYCPIKGDIWSLGVVIYTMLNKSNPFDGKDAKTLYKNQMARNWKFRTKYSGNYSTQVKTLVEKIFEPNVKLRINIEQILKSDWIAMDPKLTTLTTHEHKALLLAIEESKHLKIEEKKTGNTTIDVRELKYNKNSVAYVKEFDQDGFDLQLIRSNVHEERLSV